MTTMTTKRTVATLRPLVALVAAAALFGCVMKDDEETARAPAPPQGVEQGTEPVASGAPITGHMTEDEAWLERERLDPAWRTAADSDRQARHSRAAGRGAATAPPPEQAGGSDAPVVRMRARVTQEGTGAAADGGEPSPSPSAAGAAESWEAISPDAFADFSPTLPVPQEGGGPTVLALQWMLDRVSFSPGVIDGRWGKNSEKAVYWLQDSLGLEPTGRADRRLWDLLSGQVGVDGPLREHTVTSSDLEGPFLAIPEDVYAQAELDCLCYSSPAEALAERFHTTPELLARLNPDVDLASVAAGQRLWVPAVEEVAAERGIADDVAEIVVSKGGFYLHALDEAGDVLYHFPTTVGASYQPSPEGELTVTGIAYRPTYHYQPTELSTVPDDEEEAMLPAGPNSPVGLVWVNLSEDGYGIHGTSAPATIGYATSHGCVRLTNWDAVFLANRTAQGTTVRFTG
ncbi:MAG TPA: L,D-transpeptidase [Thermoanaerobaculia bacterium]